MPTVKPSELKVGDRFRYVGGFGEYCNLDKCYDDPRKIDGRVLLFVYSPSNRLLPLSLHEDTDLELVWQEELWGSAYREELEPVRDQHFAFFEQEG